jgi:hypothetical protein
MSRLYVHLHDKPVMTVHRRVLKKKKVVYLLTAARPLKYKGGRSQIVYIGTTKKGVHRIASSAAGRAVEILLTRGLKELSVFVVSCSSRSGVPTWKRLEDAIIAAFRIEYEQLPKCNSQGLKKKWNDELDKMFTLKAINKVLRQFDPTR